MSLQNIKNNRAERGFTIVELLIVIVVIGILAAIVIVAYNGVTNRAKSTKAAATAASIMKKVEAYNADGPTGAYPTTYAAMTGAASTASYYIAPAAFSLKAGPANNVVNTDSEITFNFATCVTPSGIRLQTWDYANAALVATYIGGATAASTCTNTAT